MVHPFEWIIRVVRVESVRVGHKAMDSRRSASFRVDNKGS